MINKTTMYKAVKTWQVFKYLRIDREGIIDDVITHGTSIVQIILVASDRHEFAMTKTSGKDVVGTVTFDVIGLLSTNRIIVLQ